MKKKKKAKQAKREKKAVIGKNPEEMFMSGHFACPGCGAAVAMRHIANAVGKNSIISIGTGCMEVVSTSYPCTSWKIPAIHSAFENTAATAAGIESALKSMGKEGEIKSVAIAGDGGCYIPGTKILTINGLKNVEDLKVNEKVLSVNPITLGMEEMPIIRMHKYDYKDKIVKVRHNFVHFDVSLNHNIPVFNKFKRKIDIIKAYDLLNYGRSDKINIITGNLKWGGKTKKYFYLPKILYNKFSANKKIIEKMPMNLWLEFLGYWLSEGHLSIRSSKREKYNIFILQTNKKNINKIKLCLSRLPFNHWYSKDRFIISNQQLWAYLKQFGKAKEKFILKEFKGISVSQLKILFDALILGDGEVVRQKNSKVFRYSTISQKLKDDVIEIALKLGYRVHLDERKRKGRYECAILCSDYKPTNLANLRRKNISSYDYRGKVYCPELKKNHIIIIEKDGRISLNMNSFDIGLQALSGALERGHKILYICYDNEAYQNTGIQRSSATPLHAATTTTPYLHKKHGKLEWKKNMPFIIASHNEHVYTATANIGYFADFDEKLKKAIQHLEKGPAYLQVLTPCVPGWKYHENRTIKLAKLATDTKIYPLYEIEEGKIKLSPITGAKPVESYLKEQERFAHLSKEEINEIQARVDRDYEKLKRLSSLNEKIF